jgi:signal transduction histidine kinase
VRTTEVVVRYQPDELQIVVAEDGAGPVNGRQAGHGLIGMRERAAIFGGSIETEPCAEGGFAVRARLPVRLGRPPKIPEAVVQRIQAPAGAR